MFRLTLSKNLPPIRTSQLNQSFPCDLLCCGRWIKSFSTFSPAFFIIKLDQKRQFLIEF